MTAPTLAVPFNPLAPEQRENPFDILAAARREQPVFYVPALKLWVVTRYDDVLGRAQGSRDVFLDGRAEIGLDAGAQGSRCNSRGRFSRDALHYRSRSTAARSYPRPRDQGFHAAADRFARARHPAHRRRIARAVAAHGRNRRDRRLRLAVAAARARRVARPAARGLGAAACLGQRLDSGAARRPAGKAARACARHCRLAALFSRCRPAARARADRRSDRRAGRRPQPHRSAADRPRNRRPAARPDGRRPCHGDARDRQRAEPSILVSASARPPARP